MLELMRGTRVAEPFLLHCWHCMAAYDAANASWCNHVQPTKICPFCLKCFCDATDEYKKKFVQTCPPEMLNEVINPQQSYNLKIGEILIKAGKITSDQLSRALEKQQVLKKKLGEVLVMMSLLTPDELQLYLLNQKSIEEIDLQTVDIDPSLLDHIGKNFCLDHRIIPIEIQEIKGDRILRVALHSLEGLSKIKKIPKLERYRLIPYLAKKEEIEALLKSIENGQKEIRVYTSKKSVDYVEMLNKIVSAAIANAASGIFFELKGDQLNIFLQTDENLTKIDLMEGKPLEFFERIKGIIGIKKIDKNIVQKSFLNLSKKYSHLRIKTFYNSGQNQETVRFKIINLERLAVTVADLNLDSLETALILEQLKKPNGLFLIVGPNSDKVNETLYAFIKSIKSERLATVETEVLLRDERHFQIEIESQDVESDVYQNLLFHDPQTMFLFDFFKKNYHPVFHNFAGRGKLFLGANAITYEELFTKLRDDLEIPLAYVVKHLRLLVLQRLVKILCPHCKKINPRRARELFKKLELKKDYQLYQENGCDKCQSTGHERNEVLYEIFTLSDEDRASFREQDLFNLSQKLSESAGMTIPQKVLNLVLRGDVSFREGQRFF